MGWGDIRFCGQEQTLIHINFAPTEKENQTNKKATTTKTPKKIHSTKYKRKENTLYKIKPQRKYTLQNKNA